MPAGWIQVVKVSSVVVIVGFGGVEGSLCDDEGTCLAAHADGAIDMR